MCGRGRARVNRGRGCGFASACPAIAWRYLLSMIFSENRCALFGGMPLAHHVRGERMAASIAEERRLFGDRLQELLVLVIDVVAEVPFCWRTVKFGVCVPGQSTECGSIGLSWASSTSMCMRDK
jgi:hypothetical protein